VEVMKDYQMMLKAYQEAGEAPDIFKDSKVAHLVVHKNKVLGRHLVEGVILNIKETDSGVDINLSIKEGVRIAYPVHLCFGVLPKEGRQEIKVNALIKKGAKITILAHCIFPNAVKVQHIMEANFVLEDKAAFQYDEVHYHGLRGGTKVIPRAKIKVGKAAHLATNFSLIKGRVGELNIDYQAEVDENGVLEMVTRAYGYGDDEIRVKESGKLHGENAKGLIKTRVAVRERARSEVISELEASAANARGHVDCIETVQGEAKAKAIPLVNVLHDKAQVTHEAAIGRVNQKELETLMARGMKEEEAIDIIIGGILK
jgi:Fe-S cluster assembly scaffold protein SufB